MASLTRYRRNMVNARISKIQPTVFRRLLMRGLWLSSIQLGKLVQSTRTGGECSPP